MEYFYLALISLFITSCSPPVLTHGPVAPIPVVPPLTNQVASGLVQSVYDVIAKAPVATIPHKNNIIAAVKLAIEVLPKDQAVRDASIDAAVANNGKYAGLANLIKTQVNLVDPIPVVPPLTSQVASGLVQSVYDVIAKALATIPHKNNIIAAVKLAIEVLPKDQAVRDASIDAAVANNGKYAGLANLIKTQVNLVDPIPVVPPLTSQAASGLVQSVYDVIAKALATIPHKNNIIAAVKLAIEVLPKDQAVRDASIDAAVANNGKYAGLADLIKAAVDLAYPIKHIKDYKLTAKFFTQPKVANIPAVIPSAPSCAKFTTFVESYYPKHLTTYIVQSGAQPQTVVGRLCAALDDTKVRGLFNQGNFNTPQLIYEDLNKKLRVVYDSLIKINDKNKVSIILDKLMDRSRHCLAALGGAIEEAYVATQIGEVGISDQINNFLVAIKDNALTSYVQTQHPASISDAIMNNINKARKQFPHVKNTYIKVFGADLGFRKEAIDAIRNDPHIDHKLEANILSNKAAIINQIKALIKLQDIILGGATSGLMDDINHGSMNSQVDIIFNNTTPNSVPLPFDSCYVDGAKLGAWIYTIEYGGTLDGVNYNAIDDFAERFEFARLSKADQDMLSKKYDLDKLATTPKDVQDTCKRAYLLTPETTLWLLEIEGFIKKK